MGLFDIDAADLSQAYADQLSHLPSLLGDLFLNPCDCVSDSKINCRDTNGSAQIQLSKYRDEKVRML